jgi:hypothetical protein
MRDIKKLTPGVDDKDSFLSYAKLMGKVNGKILEEIP